MCDLKQSRYRSLGDSKRQHRTRERGGLASKIAGTDARFSAWIAALESRHLRDLTFPEVTRALRALSSTYVERRRTLTQGAALATRGKRAAFALFYAPLHYLLVEHIVRSLPDAQNARTIIDLGCGTGAAGAAWAMNCVRPAAVVGLDRNAWAVGEAAETYRTLGLSGRAKRDRSARLRLPKAPVAVLAAFMLNECADVERETVLERLVDRKPGHVLIVEPIGGLVAPWWNRWRDRFLAAGGRADQWRVRVELPAIVAKLDHAAGLDHREITGRSLWKANA